MPIYEFSAFVRVAAESQEEAMKIVEGLADATLTSPEAHLSLDDGEPSIEEDEDEL